MIGYWSFGRILHPPEPSVWVPVRILRETDKALLVFNGAMRWIPKSQIQRIRLRGRTIEFRTLARWVT